MLQILEELSTYTHLGIRFWDPALNEQIRGGLSVLARPLAGSGRAARARRTASDIYAFNGLPGLRTLEHSAYNPETSTSPEPVHSYIIEVADARQRFLKAAFRVDLPLPYRGVYLTRTTSSPSRYLPRFILYSTPNRKIPALLTAIRGELIDSRSGDPAAHAVLKIFFPDGRTPYGLADEKGRFAVVIPYPTIEGAFVGSPRIFVGKPLSEQRWSLRVEVLYEPDLLESIPHTDLPNYLSILSQEKPAWIWTGLPDTGSPPDSGGDVDGLPATLEFGRELVLRTAGESQLFIRPRDSSP